MGTVQSSTVVIVSGSISTNSKLEKQWLTLGITAQSSSSGTCTTLTETVPWTKAILNAWQSATPSSRARVTGMRLLSKRTRRSWLTCGTKLLTWLTSTRTAKSHQKSFSRELIVHAKENLSMNYQMLSNFSLTHRSERLTLTVTVPLVWPNSGLTASTGWPTRALETLMPPTTSCSTILTKTRRLEVSLLPATKNCTPNSLATPTRPAQLSTCLAPLRSSTKRAVSLSVVMKKINTKKTKNNYLYHRG